MRRDTRKLYLKRGFTDRGEIISRSACPQNLGHEQGRLFRINVKQLRPTNQEQAFCVRITEPGSLSEI
jgi:hypothetical protein